MVELDAFEAMKGCIASFDDELPKLKKDAERLNNLAKLVSDLSIAHISYLPSMSIISR
jgi:hypothetical protein